MTNQKYTKTDNRNNYYKLLQVGKTQLNWDDEFYYGIWLPMQGATLKDGKYSASTLSITQLAQAVEKMKASGFKVKKAKSSKTIVNDDKQMLKIMALWQEMHGQGIVRNPSQDSLQAYIKRVTGLDSPEWLSSEQASKLIESLKKWQQRVLNGKPA